MANYVAIPEEADHYSKELWYVIKNGTFKIRISGVYPFTSEGAQGAQRELTTPGGKTVGKLLLKIADE